MEFTIWDYSSLASKWLIYMGISVAIGGPFIAALIKPMANIKPVVDYIRFCLGIGIIAVIVNFFIQVGAVSGYGFFGMFDLDIAGLLWQNATGDALFWRLLGFIAVGFAVFFARVYVEKLAQVSTKNILLLLYVFALFSFSYSFTVMGFHGETGGLAPWLIAVHILTMAWWIGALYPLLLCCRLLQPQPLYQVMHLFGQLTMVLVSVLLLCGFSLLMLNLGSPEELFTTLYGQTMLLKLAVVSIILCITAIHKYRLVPTLAQKFGTYKLQQSLVAKMLLADITLVITAVLSTLLTPLS